MSNSEIEESLDSRSVSSADSGSSRSSWEGENGEAGAPIEAQVYQPTSQYDEEEDDESASSEDGASRKKGQTRSNEIVAQATGDAASDEENKDN